MDEHEVSWDDAAGDFGQKSDLCVRIREICRNYPEGTSIIKELIQNADDAGAKDFKLCLDLRQHGTNSVVGPGMAQYQGPSILAFNSARFQEADFQSIQRIGDSLKKATSKGSKTGRFGIGFNSVYHLTEVPQFVSGRNVIWFDPHATSLPGVNPANPGKMIDFRKNESLLKKYPDQFAGFRAFGCDFKRDFEGTLFRFPLRTPEQAAVSRISHRGHSVDEAAKLLRDFADEASSMLLFLKAVETVEIFEWEDGASSPTKLFESRVSNPSTTLRQQRSFVLTAVEVAAAAASSKDSSGLGEGVTTSDFMLEVESRMMNHSEEIASSANDEGPSSSKLSSLVSAAFGRSKVNIGSTSGPKFNKQCWYICNQLGGGESGKLSIRPDVLHLRLVPWAGVAALLSSSDDAEENRVRQFEGRGYCFLPLPVKTGLPLHVNGYFELSSNRRDIWHGDDMGGDGQLRSQWNTALLKDVVTPCYGRLMARAAELTITKLSALKSSGSSIFNRTNSVPSLSLDRYHHLFPPEGCPAPWNAVFDSFFKMAKHERILFTQAGGGRWVPLNEAVLLGKVGAGQDGDDDAEEKERRYQSKNVKVESQGISSLAPQVLALFPKNITPSGLLSAVLIADNIPLVNAPSSLTHALLSSGTVGVDHIATPSFIRRHFTSSNSYLSLKTPLTVIPNTDVTANEEDSVNVSIQLVSIFLLEVCLQGVPASKYASELAGLPLLPLANGELGFLRSKANVDKSSIDTLTVMGFSEAAARRALDRNNGNTDRAIDWLFENQGQDQTESVSAVSSGKGSGRGVIAGDPFFCCSDDEAMLLQAAGGCLINQDALPAGSLIKSFLANSVTAKQLNIEPLTPRALPDLLGEVLPQEWEKCKVAKWAGSTNVQHPTALWFRKLWGYLASHGDVVPFLADGWPLVPTNEGEVRPLSRSEAIVSSRELTTTLRSLLSNIGCPTLLDDLFVSEVQAVESVSETSQGHLDSDSSIRPPEQFWSYVFRPTRAGLLPALDALQRRNTMKLLAIKFEESPPDMKDALRMFLSREPAIELDDVEAAIAATLPIYRSYVPNEKYNKPENDLSTEEDTLNENDKVAALERVMAPSKFVAISQQHSSAPCFLIEETMETDDDVIPEGFLGGFASANERGLCIRAGAVALRRCEFWRRFVFSQLESIDSIGRDRALVSMLLELPRLTDPTSKGDESFAAFVSKTQFLPSCSECKTVVDEDGIDSTADPFLIPLHCPESLFDPEVRELHGLVDPSLFPASPFDTARVLGILRSLGLQSALTWPGVLQCAQAVENSSDRGEDEAAATQGGALLKFLDTKADSLFGLNVKERKKEEDKRRSSSWGWSIASAVGNVVGNAVGLNAAEKEREMREEAERVAHLALIAELRWVPVAPYRLDPHLPWRAEEEAHRLKRGRVVVASPNHIRLLKDMWLCSHAKFCLEPSTNVSHPELIAAFGWNLPLPPTLAATQLCGIVKVYEASKPEVRHERMKQQKESEETLRALISSDNDDDEDKLISNILPREMKSSADIGELQRRMASAVPRLYTLLDSITSREEINELISIFAGERWIWVGTDFVEADRVAFSTPANAAPYLYAVPPDLVCFKNLLTTFGVCSSFGTSDWVSVLKQMAVETNAMMEKDSAPIPLTSAQLELALLLVQVLSDDTMRVGDLELYAPDDRGFLVLTTDLVYNDAPWLAKEGVGNSGGGGGGGEQQYTGGDFRLVHPKISAGVGEKVGVKSLRLLLATTHSTEMDFGIQSESFGQSESITRRLRHILELYPEGPSILSELIQNADDARASTVKVLYNTRSYGTKSLLGPKMADWQGAALYVYNDATFSSRDFNNLVKIGQASKLDRLVTTGRFGLGFNSVYHFTDCPSLVSGDSLVTFDPHVNFLPGATASQPGIKIKFTHETQSARLKEHFPDQFTPLCFFGCDLNTYYDGTLFRFPLRTKALAQQSEISKAHYDDPASVHELINSFRQTAERFLLFLRNVAHIEVLILDDECIGDQPRSLFTVSAQRSPLSAYRMPCFPPRDVPCSQTTGGWNAIQDFITGPDPSAPLSKDRFYQRLTNTPMEQLPQVEQLVTITFTEHAVLANQKDTFYFKEDAEGEPPPEVMVSSSQVDEFMVVACLGGGAAQRMAVDVKNQAMKFIPWGGVAAHLRRNGISTLLADNALDENQAKFAQGKAFCFLPLPVGTGMPVHINGYFELSSNRRDIWFGQDMAGDGKRRSEWNSVLLSDAIGPAYARLLAAGARLFGDEDHALYLSLWPTAVPSEPWRTAYKALFKGTKDLPVLFTTLNGGSWIPASQAIVINSDQNDKKMIEIETDQTSNDNKNDVDIKNTKGMNELNLANILLAEGLPVVEVPKPLQSALVSEDAVRAEAGPVFVREHFSSSSSRHNCLEPSKLEGGVQTARHHALYLLSIACADVNIPTRRSDFTRFDVLENLPLIPLTNETMGTFQHRFLNNYSDNDSENMDSDEEVADLDNIDQSHGNIDHMRFIVDNENEKLLLSSLPEKLVALNFEEINENEEELSEAERAVENGRIILREIANCGRLNVLKMSPQHLSILLELLLPADWSPTNLHNFKLDQVPWVPPDAALDTGKPSRSIADYRSTPKSRDRQCSVSRTPPPSERWIINFWRYLCAQDHDEISTRVVGGIKTVGSGLPLSTSSGRNQLPRRYESFMIGWPLLPCFQGGNGRRVLRQLQPVNGSPVRRVAVVNPSHILSPELCECLAMVGVAVVDTHLLADCSSSPVLGLLAEPPTARGVINALFAPYELNPVGEDMVTDEVAGRIRSRFQTVDLKLRDCLRLFLRDPQSFQNEPQGKLPYELTYLIQALPIFPVFNTCPTDENTNANYQTLRPIYPLKKETIQGRRRETALSIFSRKWLPPDDEERLSLLFDHTFVKCVGSSEQVFVEQLGISKLSLADFFLYFVIPRIDPHCNFLDIINKRDPSDDDEEDEEEDHLNHSANIDKLFNRSFYNNIPIPEACHDIGLRLLDDYQKLVKIEPKLKACCMQCRFIPDGLGDLRRPNELYDPTRDLLALLSEDKFPDRDHSTPSTLGSLKSLGLQTSLTCEGVLVSARSVELMSETSEKNDKNAQIAIRRGVDLVKFLDHHLGDLIKLTKRQYNFGAEEEATYQEELALARKQLELKHSKPLIFQKNKKNAKVQNPLSQAATAALDSDAEEAEVAADDSFVDDSFDAGLDDEEDDDELAMHYAREAAKKEEMETKIFEAEWALKPPWAKPWQHFLADLFNISWMPVHRTKNSLSSGPCSSSSSSAVDALLPWPKQGWSVVLVPSRVRPKEDAWICSYTFGLSLYEVRSEELREALGWNEPVKPGAVASQILLLAKAYASVLSEISTPEPNAKENEKNEKSSNKSGHPLSAAHQDDVGEKVRALRTKVSAEIPRLYAVLSTFVGTPELGTVARSLGQKPWLWVGDCFVGTNQVAFDAPMNARPYLHRVPPELEVVAPLLRALGVRDSFDPNDFIKTLNQIETPANSGKLSEDEVGLAVSMCKMLARVNKEEPKRSHKNSVMAPSTAGTMEKVENLVYDDASWLSSNIQLKSLKFVHPDIDNDTAALIGVSSLRNKLLSSSADQVPILCPAPEALRDVTTMLFGSEEQFAITAVSGGQNSLTSAAVQACVSELAVLADHCGRCSAVKITLDERKHGVESLIHPALTATQGPALVVAFEGVVLDHETLIKLNMPSNYRFGAAKGLGKGLCAAYHLTDCLQVFSGNNFHVFDPCGQFLFTGDESDNQRAKENPATARKYALDTAGSNIFDRFPDQFAPFLSLHPQLENMISITPSSRSGGGGTKQTMTTVFRLPLRKVASNISPCVPPLTSVRAALIASESKLRSSLLFTSWLGSIVVDHWPQGGQLDTVFRASLRPGPVISASNSHNASNTSSKASDPRAKRRAMLENREAWVNRGKGMLNIFSKYSPPRDAYALCIDIEYRERLPVAAITEDSGPVHNQEAVAVANNSMETDGIVIAAAVSMGDNPNEQIFEATATPSEVPESDSEVNQEEVPISLPSNSLMAVGRVVQCTDRWILRCSVAPTSELRDLALGDSLKPLDLLQVISVAARVSSIETRSNGSADPDIATNHRTPQGSLFVGADSGIPTGLPFHVDGPFFVRDVSLDQPRHSLYVSPQTSHAAAADIANDGSDDNDGGTRAAPQPNSTNTDAAAQKVAADAATNQSGGGASSAGGAGGRGPDISAADLIRGKWNELLLDGAMVELVPDLLVDIRDNLRAKFKQERSSLYRFWPQRSLLEPGIMSVLIGGGRMKRNKNNSVYAKLAMQNLYLAVGNKWLPASGGVFRRHELPYKVEMFIQKYTPLFLVPSGVAEDLRLVSSLILRPGDETGLREMTPTTLRRMLRVNAKDVAKHLNQNPDLALQLLEFCLLDCGVPDSNDGNDLSTPVPAVTSAAEDSNMFAPNRVTVARLAEDDDNGRNIDDTTRLRRWAELVRVPILPLANGTVGSFSIVPRESMNVSSFVCASQRQKRLLPSVSHRFISDSAFFRLRNFFSHQPFCDALGIAQFSPQFLAQHIHLELPLQWRGATSIAWNPHSLPSTPNSTEQPVVSSPNIQWLSQFWEEVNISEPENLELFSDWPLLPIHTPQHSFLSDGEILLMSCELSEIVLHVPGGMKQELSENVIKLRSEFDKFVTCEVERYEQLREKELREDIERRRQMGWMRQVDELPMPPSNKSKPIPLGDSTESLQSELPGVPSSSRIPPPLPPRPFGGPLSVSDQLREVRLQRQVENAARAEEDDESSEDESNLDEALAASLVPPSSSTPQQPNIAIASRTSPTCLPILVTLRAPLLELSFFSQESIAAARFLVTPSDPINFSRVLLNSLASLTSESAEGSGGGGVVQEAATRLSAAFRFGPTRSSPDPRMGGHNLHGVGSELLQLAWDCLEESELDVIMSLISKPGGQPAVLTPSLADKLKHLPLFETLAGAPRVALLPSNRQTSTTSGDSDFYTLGLDMLDDTRGLPLPPSAKSRFLVYKTELVDVYRDLGIPVLSLAGVVTRFLLPGFGEMEEMEQLSLLTFIKENWHELKRDSEEFLNAMKEVAFCKVNDAVLVKPNTLMDPSHTLLAFVFNDDKSAFPPDFFCDDEWLSILRECGLKSKLDRDTYLQCARHVESLCSFPLNAVVEDKSSQLLRFLIEHDDDFYDSTFARNLATVRFVPAELIRWDASDSIDETVLVSFSDAAVYKDRHLVWTSKPVIPVHLVPPQMMWSSLSIKSPPEIELVLRHFKCLITSRNFDRWPFSDPAVAVFNSIFTFLEDHWDKVSPAIKQSLSENPCVPVGMTLVKANRLYFRMGTNQNLAPFMFEVPRALGSHEMLLKALGAKQSPTISDFNEFLHELNSECRGSSLNPNEVEATLKVVKSVAVDRQKQAMDHQAALPSNLFVPDDRCTMVPTSEVLFNDSPWLRGRVKPESLRYVHPCLDLQTCHSLQISNVSDVIEEQLEEGFQPEYCSNEFGDEQERFSALLNSRELAVGITCIVDHHRGSSAQGYGEVSGEELANKVHRAISGYDVRYVTGIRSRFLKKIVKSTGGEKEKYFIDITSADGANGSLHFMLPNTGNAGLFSKGVHSSILVARSQLPSSITPAYVVALALVQHVLPSSIINSLKGDVDSLVAPLAAVLGSQVSEVGAVLRLLRLEQDERGALERRRGVPGQLLLEEDKSNIEFKPLRVFIPDEVVACSTVKDGPLIYARVIIGEDEDDITSGADEEIDQCIGSQSHLKKVRLLVGTGLSPIVKLASEVYSFKAARERLGEPKNGDTEIYDGSEENAQAIHIPSLKDQLISVEKRRAADDKAPTQVPQIGHNEQPTDGLPVGEFEMLEAVEDILAKVDLSLKSDQKTLMEDTLRLKSRLDAATRDLEVSRSKVAELSDDFAKIPDEYRCPITREVMDDPVICSDGHTYEREAIERWLGGHRNSPKTNAPLPTRTVLPNHNLRAIIETFKSRRGV